MASPLAELLANPRFQQARAQHLPLVYEAAAAVGIDPRLLDATIMRESRYMANARGASGEYGLGQLMPATGKSVGLDTSNPFDPRSNIYATARYLAQAVKKANGDWGEAGYRYNAGLNARPGGSGTDNYRQWFQDAQKYHGALGPTASRAPRRSSLYTPNTFRSSIEGLIGGMPTTIIQQAREQNASYGVKGSAHKTSFGIDLRNRTLSPEQSARIVAQAQALGFKAEDVRTPEQLRRHNATGPHIHIEVPEGLRTLDEKLAAAGVYDGGAPSSTAGNLGLTVGAAAAGGKPPEILAPVDMSIASGKMSTPTYDPMKPEMSFAEMLKLSGYRPSYALTTGFKPLKG